MKKNFVVFAICVLAGLTVAAQNASAQWSRTIPDTVRDITNQVVYQRTIDHQIAGQVVMTQIQMEAVKQQSNNVMTINDRQMQATEYQYCIQRFSPAECRGGSNQQPQPAQQFQQQSQDGGRPYLTRNAAPVQQQLPVVNGDVAGFRARIVNSSSLVLRLGDPRGPVVQSALDGGNAVEYVFPNMTAAEALQVGLTVFDPVTGCSARINFWNKANDGMWVDQILPTSIYGLQNCVVARAKKPGNSPTASATWQ